MSLTTDLEMAYHMGYDDALARHKPDASKVHMLGRGTCHKRPHINLTIGDDFLKQSGWDCSECGCRLNLPVIARYCPNCGRKVVDPTTNDVDTEVNDG